MGWADSSLLGEHVDFAGRAADVQDAARRVRGDLAARLALRLADRLLVRSLLLFVVARL